MRVYNSVHINERDKKKRNRHSINIFNIYFPEQLKEYFPEFSDKHKMIV